MDHTKSSCASGELFNVLSFVLSIFFVQIFLKTNKTIHIVFPSAEFNTLCIIIQTDPFLKTVLYFCIRFIFCDDLYSNHPEDQQNCSDSSVPKSRSSPAFLGINILEIHSHKSHDPCPKKAEAGRLLVQQISHLLEETICFHTEPNTFLPKTHRTTQHKISAKKQLDVLRAAPNTSSF